MKERSRFFRSMALMLCVVVVGLFVSGTAIAAGTQEVKLAMAYPLSGAFSRSGNLIVQSIKAAIGWVNDNGGIKSLGGAKLVPVIGDTGSTVEGAASTMERICRDPEIAMAMGSWASSLTLSSTEVTERLGIPQFSISFVDKLNERGFKWGFYVTPPTSSFGTSGTANQLKVLREFGTPPKTAMVVCDNGAAGMATSEAAKKYLISQGIKMVGDVVWSAGTLTDATPVMQKVKSANPDVVIFNPTAMSEIQMCLMKKTEMGIKAPLISGGGPNVDPTMRDIGAKYIEGSMSLAATYQHKLFPEEWIKRSLEQCRKEYSNEPWVGQDLGYGWTLVPIMAQVLELAGSKDRNAIWQAAHKLDIHDVMATRALPGQGMAFDETGV